jgi:hypothetical protein
VSKFAFLFFCVSFLVIFTAQADQETVHLRGALALEHCQTDGGGQRCILLNADREPFDVVLELQGNILEGEHEFQASFEARMFKARVRITKYKDIAGLDNYNIDIFTESWIDGDNKPHEKRYLGYFAVRKIEGMSEMGVWGSRVGKDSDFFAPFVLLSPAAPSPAPGFYFFGM